MCFNTSMLLLIKMMYGRVRNLICFNTSMLLLIELQPLVWANVVLFQYIHVTINPGALSIMQQSYSFQYIHVTINQKKRLTLYCQCERFNTSMLLLIKEEVNKELAGILFQYIHVTINQRGRCAGLETVHVSIHPCYY